MVGDQPERHLAKRQQDLRPELGLKRARGLGRAHDLAPAKPLEQDGGRDVNDLQLVDPRQHVIRERRPRGALLEERRVTLANAGQVEQVKRTQYRGAGVDQSGKRLGP